MEQGNGAYRHAVKLLSIRDYSSVELQEKLKQRGHSDAKIQEALDLLASQNYLNDNRYLAGKIRYYARKMKSPRYIYQSLREKNPGISYTLIEETFEELGIDIDDHIRYHVVKKIRAMDVSWSELDAKEKYDLKVRLHRRVASLGYEVTEIEKYITE